MRTFLQQKVHEKNHQKCVTKVETFLQQNMVFIWFLHGFSHGRKCCESITFVWIFSSVVVRQVYRSTYRSNACNHLSSYHSISINIIIISFYLPTSNILYTSCLYSLDMLSSTILAYPQSPYRCDHQSLGYCPHGANRFTSSLRPPITGLLPSWCQSLHTQTTISH